MISTQALGVAPKKAKHAEATAELDSAMAVLNAAQSRLKEVVDKLDKLEQSLKAAVDEKQSLADKEIECKTRLSNADKLIGGLGGEQAIRQALCRNQIFNPTSMCAYANVLTRALPPCFENSLRANVFVQKSAESTSI